MGNRKWEQGEGSRAALGKGVKPAGGGAALSGEAGPCVLPTLECLLYARRMAAMRGSQEVSKVPLVVSRVTKG